MLHVTVVISGTKEEQAKFKKLGSKLTDFSTAFKSMGDELKNYYGNTMFNSEGGAGGTKWQDLSPVYKARKGKLYPNKGILTATGTMRKSFRATVTPNSLTIDNTDKKFAWHQNGTGYGGGAVFGIGRGGSAHIGRGRNLPARPMLVTNEDVKGIVKRVIEDDINQKLESVT